MVAHFFYGQNLPSTPSELDDWHLRFMKTSWNGLTIIFLRRWCLRLSREGMDHYLHVATKNDPLHSNRNNDEDIL